MPFRAYCCKLPPSSTPEQLEAGFAGLFRAAFGAEPSAAADGISYNWLGCTVRLVALAVASKQLNC